MEKGKDAGEVTGRDSDPYLEVASHTSPGGDSELLGLISADSCNHFTSSSLK